MTGRKIIETLHLADDGLIGAGDLRRHLMGGRKQLIARHDAIHQTHLLRVPRRDIVAGQREFLGFTNSDGPRQASRHPTTRHHADPRVRISKLCLFGSDHNVAGERELESPGDRETVDCADYRHLHVVDHADEGGVAFVVDPARACAELAEVETDTEGPARAGDNHYTDVLIALQLLHCMAECQSQLTIEGIKLVRPVEGDSGNTVLLIDEDYRLTHCARHSYCNSPVFIHLV